MNKVILMGRLTADPEIRSTAGEHAYTVARFSIAVDRRVAKGDQKTDFFNVTAWEKKAEFAEKYLKKGTKIVLTGRLASDTVEKDGHKTTYVSVVAEDLEFAESKKNAAPEAEAPAADADGFMNAAPDIAEELPFN